MEQVEKNLSDNHMIQINAQYIKDLSFESPNPLQAFKMQDKEMNFNVNMEINNQQVGEDIYEVVLAITVNALKEGTTIYICELQYAGLITLKNILEDHKQNYLMIECPKLIFPFARQIISNTTLESGFQPFLMQPIDFSNLYQERAIEDNERN